MANILHRLRQVKSNLPNREHGSATFVFMLLVVFPVAIFGFGLGLDTMMAQATRSTLQSDLDAATQSAVSQSNPNLTTAAQIANQQTVVDGYFREIYAQDRLGVDGASNSPTLLCQGTQTPYYGNGSIPVYPSDTHCGYSIVANNFQALGGSGSSKDPSKYANTYTVTVIEYSKPMFLQLLGVERFTYRLTSTAHLAQAAYVQK